MLTYQIQNYLNSSLTFNNTPRNMKRCIKKAKRIIFMKQQKMAKKFIKKKRRENKFTKY